MNGHGSRAKLTELKVTFEWLVDSQCFKVSKLGYMEALRIKRVLEAQGLTANLDGGHFGSSH